jgi:hypothetical protein
MLNVSEAVKIVDTETYRHSNGLRRHIDRFIEYKYPKTMGTYY